MAVAHMRQIVKRYGAHLALDYVDLDIGEGEVLGLLGPNGAGKTTLIHALAGLITIDSGSIELFGKTQHRHMLDIKRHIGLVTQEITVFEDLTAQENLEFFGGIYGLKGETLKRRVAETLAIVGLSGRAGQLPAQFSGGMKRRLNIACALTHRPKLLIMDEPTVGIDPQSRNHILETVRELNRQGTTILYTTHYMEEVEAIASRVVIMDQGHVLTEGTVEELVTSIHHQEKVKMEVAIPSESLLKELRALDGVVAVTQQGSQLEIVSRAGADKWDQVFSIAKRAGGVRSLQAEKPTLEDVFLTLTGKQLRDGGEEG